MNQSLEPAEFTTSVLKYKALETHIRESFINGMIQMGELLEEQQELWKPLRLWMKYLKEIGVSQSASYQLIKLYKYAQKNHSVVLTSKITTWDRLHAFLSLPEDLRLDFAKNLPTNDISTSTYQDMAKEMKGDNEEEVDLVDEDEEEFADFVQNLDYLEADEREDINESKETSSDRIMLKDSSFTAKQMLKEFRVAGYKELTDKSLPVAEAYVDLIKTFKNLNKLTYKELHADEKYFWKKVFKGISQEVAFVQKLTS